MDTRLSKLLLSSRKVVGLLAFTECCVGCQRGRTIHSEEEVEAFFASQVVYSELDKRFGRPDTVENRGDGVLLVSYMWSPSRQGESAARMYGINCLVSNGLVLQWSKRLMFYGSRSLSQAEYGNGQDCEIVLFHVENSDIRSVLKRYAGAPTAGSDLREVARFRGLVYFGSREVDENGLQPVAVGVPVDGAVRIIRGREERSDGVWVVASEGVIIGASEDAPLLQDRVLSFTGVAEVMRRVWVK